MDDFQKLLLETFAEEVRETAGALEKALLGLEESANTTGRQENYAILCRRAHNLKGAAGAAGVTAVQSLAHALEDALEILRDNDLSPNAPTLDLLYRAVDSIRDLTDAGAEEPDEALENQLRAVEDLLDEDGAKQETGDRVAGSTGFSETEPRVPDAETPPTAVQQGVPPAPAAETDPGVHAEPPKTPSQPTSQPASQPASQPKPEPAPEPAGAPAADEPGGAPVADVTVGGESEEQEPAETRRAALPGRRNKGDQPAPRRTARIAVDKLDALMNQIGEIIMVRNKSQARVQEVEEIADDMAAAVREFQATRKLLDRVVAKAEDEERYSSLADSMVSFTKKLNHLEQRFTEFRRRAMHESATESLLTERLPEDIKRLRMRPFDTLEDQLRRVVRDAARQCDKLVKLELIGGDNEADQVVLEVIRDPLMHLLRNSVDHGIEPPEEREVDGKNRTGRITIDVEARGATLLIRVSDDGQGIDPRMLRRRLAERNLMPDAHLETMTDQEIIDMIFTPGFSTARSTGVISGRGIGMDVVRQVIHQHHGSISIDTEVGVGTTFELTIPLTFATVQGIIIRVLGHDLALPMYALERLIRISRNEVTYLEGTPTVTIEGDPVSLVPLSEVLEVPPNFHLPDERDWEDEVFEPAGESMLYGAIVKANETRLAFLVDDFIGESEMVVKDIPVALGMIKNVAGATITWSGEVMVILNPNDLVETALGMGAAPGKRPDWGLAALPTRRILVCDDSVTTRTLEKNILVAAGYDVSTATNGIEALRLCEEQSFQLIILDVDMPELTGFELTVRLRQMKAYREVPIILVTSRDTEDDKRRGLAAGADAYITKQSFTQRTFLETVRRFLE